MNHNSAIGAEIFQLFAPVAQDTMARSGGGVIAGRVDKFATTQILERSLNGAFGKAGRVGEGTQACGDWFPFVPCGLTVEIQINKVSRRPLVVPDKIAHQDIEQVIIDWNNFSKSRHGLVNQLYR